MLGTRSIFRQLSILLLMLSLLLPAGLAGRPAQAQAAIPQLSSPPDGAFTTADNHPPTGTPRLVWEAVPGAERYTVRICPLAGCANPRVSLSTYTTSYVYDQALPDGEWYWQVRALDSTGWSDYSSSWMFTKSWLDYGQMSPLLLEPASDEIVEFFDSPIFSWTPVIGAAYYRFQIATDLSFANIVYSLDTIMPAHTPTSRRSRGDYYWRVTPLDRRAHQGDPSEVRHFFMDFSQVPTLLAPDDNTIQTFTPEFRWTAVRGANQYHLQISTVEDFSTTELDTWTNNSRFTPDSTLENDREYYWRIAARDRVNTEGPWSEVRSFVMQWHLVPRLLSPTFSYASTPFPVFHWVPVAGKTNYFLNVSQDQSFPNPIPYRQTLPDPRFEHFNWGEIQEYPHYWRVQSTKDASVTPWSQTSYFRWSWTCGPTLIYPSYYYDPDLEPSTQPLDVRTDPTVPVPVFMWDRLLHYISESDQRSADYYTIEVSEDPNFGSLAWYTGTANLSIAPTVENPFVPTPGTDYYWRVKAWRGGSEMSPYSERWVARFDPSLQVYTDSIELYFPADKMDNVYDTPLFGWSPVQGAAQYHFQIDTVPTFDSADLEEEYALYSFYTPLEHYAPETYYWRVRAQDAGQVYIGDWSEARRLVITHPLRQDTDDLPLPHPIRLASSHTRIGNDPTGDAAFPDYDLNDLYLARSDDAWYLTIDLPPTNTTDMYFVFYVDLDHEGNSGGDTDPMGFNVQADTIYLPEVVLAAHHEDTGQISEVALYRWLGYTWDGPYYLGPAPDIGGGWDYFRGEYLELEIPHGQFNVFDYIGTISVEAFAASAGGQAYDTVPSEASSPTSQLTNFTAVADKLNPLHPWDNPFGNPTVYSFNPSLSFSKPLYRSYVKGYDIEVARDYAFTEVIMSNGWDGGRPPMYWHLSTRWSSTSTFEENNTLYWRVRMDHGASGVSPWTQPVRFTKRNYVPENMETEYDYATPIFSWDMVEGSAFYRLEVDEDPEFGTPKVYTTDNTSRTPPDSYADGTWSWRVKVVDGSNRVSDYSEVISFTKRSPVPVLTNPISEVVVNELPFFQWQYILHPPEGDAILSAPRYRFLLDDDPNFSSPYILTQNLDTNSLTLNINTKIEDGTYYWKVAMLDTSGNVGPYSEPEIFYKAYLQPTPLTATFGLAPYLVWEPLPGAAYYEAQICSDPSYTVCPEQNIRTDQTSYVSTSKYATGTYYWRVRMCDVKAACGPYYEDKLASGYLIFVPLLSKDASF